jgi:universal stress protein A
VKTRNARRKIVEAAIGTGIGAAIAGPVGAVAGGLAAGHAEEGLARLAKRKTLQPRARIEGDDPLVHVWPKRILVPLDFSPPSKRAMRFAGEWASIFTAEVVLLHVIDPQAAAVGFEAVPPGTIQRDLPTKARLALEQLAQASFGDPIPVRVVVRKGRAGDQIATAAQDLRADLIIMATHGYTGFKHMFLGSTAERVARRAPCPVLILRRRPTARTERK